MQDCIEKPQDLNVFLSENRRPHKPADDSVPLHGRDNSVTLSLEKTQKRKRGEEFENNTVLFGSIQSKDTNDHSDQDDMSNVFIAIV